MHLRCIASSTRRVVAAVAALVGLASCEVEPGLPEVEVDPGVFWAVSAKGAQGRVGDDSYLIVDELGDPVVGGRCICIPLHTIFLSTQQGLVEPSAWSVTVDNWIRGNARVACEARAEVLGMDPGTDDCAEVVNSATPFQQGQCAIYSPGPECLVIPNDEGTSGTDTGGP